MRLIHLLRKPVSEGTVASNVLKHGVGAINIEASRISTQDSLDGGAYAKNPTPRADSYDMWTSERKGDSQAMRRGFADYEQPAGRWPANLILQHLPGCRCEGTTKIRAITGTRAGRHESRGWGMRGTGQPTGHGDADGNETVANWTCVEGCPVPAIDEQSGVSGEPYRMTVENEGRADELQWRFKPTAGTLRGHGDSGGASRFFKQVGGEK